MTLSPKTGPAQKIRNAEIQTVRSQAAGSIASGIALEGSTSEKQKKTGKVTKLKITKAKKENRTSSPRAKARRIKSGSVMRRRNSKSAPKMPTWESGECTNKLEKTNTARQKNKIGRNKKVSNIDIGVKRGMGSLPTGANNDDLMATVLAAQESSNVTSNTQQDKEKDSNHLRNSHLQRREGNRNRLSSAAPSGNLMAAVMAAQQTSDYKNVKNADGTVDVARRQNVDTMRARRHDAQGHPLPVERRRRRRRSVTKENNHSLLSLVNFVHTWKSNEERLALLEVAMTPFEVCTLLSGLNPMTSILCFCCFLRGICRVQISYCLACHRNGPRIKRTPFVTLCKAD